jgi:hypothetical protein
MDPLEAEHEVGLGEVLPRQRPRTVCRDVDLKPLGGEERLPQRRDRPQVIQTVRPDLEGDVVRKRADQARREGAAKAIARTDQI